LISRFGRYKIFMQVGFVVATIAMVLLSTLTPESTYAYEAAIMVVLGLGMGVAMPVLNLAVQNEFEQHELGIATSSNQLFRSLGSTIGTAVFGAMLTAGILTSVDGIRDTAYIQSISQNADVAKIGEVNDPNTLLTLNMPDIKNQISDSAAKQTESLPEPARSEARSTFEAQQDEFGSKVTHAFSDSLRMIFIAASVLIGTATVLVFTLKERTLKSAKPDDTPGDA
jgi:hypothetical protein